jgi:hypothetical protein
LLVGPERKIKQKGRIARTSIEPVWTWLAMELMPHRHRELNDALRDAILHSREDEIQEKIYELWAEASAALFPALSGEKKKSAASRKLGGVAATEDAEEIALVLSRAPEVDELQKTAAETDLRSQRRGHVLSALGVRSHERRCAGVRALYPADCDGPVGAAVGSHAAGWRSFAAVRRHSDQQHRCRHRR